MNNNTKLILQGFENPEIDRKPCGIHALPDWMKYFLYCRNIPLYLPDAKLTDSICS